MKVATKEVSRWSGTHHTGQSWPHWLARQLITPLSSTQRHRDSRTRSKGTFATVSMVSNLPRNVNQPVPSANFVLTRRNQHYSTHPHPTTNAQVQSIKCTQHSEAMPSQCSNHTPGHFDSAIPETTAAVLARPSVFPLLLQTGPGSRKQKHMHPYRLDEGEGSRYSSPCCKFAKCI